MKQVIDNNNWVRRDHFAFFSRFEEPFFGVTVTLDCTQLYDHAKANGHSFFLAYLHCALRAANDLPEFRCRIENGGVVLYDEVYAACTVDRPDGTFGFGYLDYYKDASDFYSAARPEFEKVRGERGLRPASSENVIHFSALPWLDFSSMSHARGFSLPDSCPKISFGKMTERDGRRTMPVSIHVHHGLADGFHVSRFANGMQQYMNVQEVL